MPNRQPTWYVDSLSKDRYGTDVPTLHREIEHLERKLRLRSEELLRRDRDLAELRRRHDKLRFDYNKLFDSYERAMELLRDQGRRLRKLY